MEERQNNIGFYTRAIHIQVERTMNAFLKERDLTKAQADVMHFVMRCHQKGYSVKQRDIEDFFHISNPTVSGILDRLEQKHLIVRVKSEEDRRVRFIELTEDGLGQMRDLSDTIARAEELMLTGISPRLYKEGMEFLRKVFDNLIKINGKEEDI